MARVKFIRDGEPNILALPAKLGVIDGAIYVATDTGNMWLGTGTSSLLSLANNVIDTNTTYSLTKSGNQITLKGSDGSEYSIYDSNTTYKDVSATGTTSGLMTPTDKAKLDGIEEGANKTIVDTEISSTSSNPVQNQVISSALAGKVPTSRTINNKSLANNVSLTYSDVGAAASSHSHKKADITDFPTSMPASDVSAWAKAASKPTYTKAEVGLGNVDNTADANKTVKEAKQLVNTQLTNQNLNDIKTFGQYYGGGDNTVTNKPTGVDAFSLSVVRTATGWIAQVLIDADKNTNKTWIRHWNATDWLAWQSYYTTQFKPTASDVGAYASGTSRTANTVLAAPNGSAGAATFRKLVAADIPSLTKSKISDFPTTLKNPNSLTIKSGATTLETYDGSAAKTLDIVGGNNVTVTTDASSGKLTISAASIGDVTGDSSGLMTAEDKKKLSGIAEGAEVNQNAFSNVTVGSTTIAADSKTDTLTLTAGTNITLTPDATNDKITIAASNSVDKAATADKATVADSANAVAWANVSGKPSTYAPSSHNHSATNITSGTLSVDRLPTVDSKVTSVDVSKLSGVIDSSHLPSYVDDVIEGYYNSSKFYTTKNSDGTFSTEITGEAGKIYTDLATNKIYRWSGSTFVVISDTITLGTTHSTAGYGDESRAAYTHSQKTSGNPHNVTKADVGLGNVENKSSATIRGELTSANVTDALGYTPPKTNTTYNNATASAAGLMSATDKDKLNGIAEGANKYVLPTASSTLGGVKTTSTVTSASGYTATPIINGVPYYKDTNTTYSAATTSAAGLMSKDDKTKLDGIATNANNYSHPTTSGNKHIPSGGSSGQILRWSADGTAVWGSDNNTWNALKGATTDAAGTAGYAPAPSAGAANRYLRSDGTWAVPPDNNTTYSDMKGATSSAAGTHGLVPAPAAGKQGQFLRGDGTWASPANTTYSTATSSANGLMSSTDKAKLDGIADNANNYSLPTATSSVLGGVKVGSNITNSSGTISLTKSNVTSALGYTPPTTNTTYSNFVKSGTGAAAGLVPAPSTTAGTTKYLREDGTWTVPPNTNTTYSTGTASTAGLTKLYTGTGTATDGTMTQAALKTALDGKASSSHTHSYLPLSGGAMTGGSSVTTSTVLEGTELTAQTRYVDSSTNKEISIGVGSDHNNRGLYDDANGAWLVYLDTNNKGYLNGNATTATRATKLAATQVGSATQPVYISSDGVPAKTTYTLGKSVPSNALFTDTTYSAATTSAAGLMSADDKAKLNGIATGANNYTYTLPNATTSVKGGVIVGSNITVSSGTISLTKSNVTSALGYTPPTTNTTYSVMGAASGTSAGSSGLVPAPAAGKNSSFLRGDGTWATPTNTTYSVATATSNGLMSAADKSRLEGLSNYTLPNATSTTLGGVKIGSNITVSSGTISLSKANVTNALGYTPPTTNTTYSTMTGATSTAAGSSGLVPAPAAGNSTLYLRGDGTWATPTDTNTTYSAGTGISLSGTTIYNAGVRSISTGSGSNGTIYVNTGGTGSYVSVKGLAGAAYKGVDTSLTLTSTSTNVPTSAAVASLVSANAAPEIAVQSTQPTDESVKLWIKI